MTLAQEINYDVKDMALAEQGKNNICLLYTSDAADE